MIDNSQFFSFLKQQGVEFFAGVPDSLLKNFCSFIDDHVDPSNHVIAANEGGALSIAAGYHLATGKVPLVYLQNSGLGNLVNPLLSLADSEVYGLPALIMIGWRGEPGVNDEPQHIKQGRVQNAMLEAMEVPFETMGADEPDIQQKIVRLLNIAREQSRPVALVVKKGTFSAYKATESNAPQKSMSREDALECILDSLDQRDIVVSTTGMCSREIFELRARKNLGHEKDFLTVGSMGHCSQIALGIAINKPERNIWCIDGDGALIMHMGALPVIGKQNCTNFRHIVINNAAHDSVGGQPTAGFNMNIAAVARESGYPNSHCVQSLQELQSALSWQKDCKGPSLLEVQVRKGARENLGRPNRTPAENKKDFMQNLNND